MEYFKEISKSSNLPTVLPTSAYHFGVTCVFWTNRSKGRVATPYIALAMGSLWVVPFRDCSVLPATYKSDGVEYGFSKTKLKAGQILLTFSINKLQLRLLKAFFASIKRKASFWGFSFSYCERREWITCSCVQTRTLGIGKVLCCRPRGVGHFLLIHGY